MSHTTGAALVIGTPWGRCGTSNLYAAQCAYFRRRGFVVAFLLSDGGSASARNEELDGSGVDAHLICRTRANKLTLLQRLWRWRSSNGAQWLWHGRDSRLAILARYFAKAEMPDDLKRFLLAQDCQVIIANHCMQIFLAEKICRFLQANGRPRPRLVLETHDVQAEQYATNGEVNIFTRRPDPRELLARDELALSSLADDVAHVTEQDMAYFAQHLLNRQSLTLATIAPATERQFESMDLWQEDREMFDFLYVGAKNFGNECSIRWFLNDVRPLLGGAYRIAIVGSICDHIRTTHPDLFDTHRECFVGVVSDIVEYYKRSHVVIIPTTSGTGTSIKTIEALASGRPIVATSLALRSIPPSALVNAHLRGHDSADEFAGAMISALNSRDETGRRSQELYRGIFSNEAYFSRYDRMIAIPAHDVAMQ